jgi:hypothetical protein
MISGWGEAIIRNISGYGCACNQINTIYARQGLWNKNPVCLLFILSIVCKFNVTNYNGLKKSKMGTVAPWVLLIFPTAFFADG